MAAATSSGTAVVTLPRDMQILITRECNAPRHLVYKSWTTPELIKRWWNGEQGKVTLAEVDLQVGGRWHYVMEPDDGFEVAFHPERLQTYFRTVRARPMQRRPAETR